MPDQLGAFAEAARAREEQLVQRLATSVELDRSFEGILRGAHQYNLQSRARLDALEAEIRRSAARWPGLDTPAGARQFQVYLAGNITAPLERLGYTGIAYTTWQPYIDNLTRNIALAKGFPLLNVSEMGGG